MGTNFSGADKGRLVSASVRAIATSSPETTSGQARVFETSQCLRSAAATWTQNQYIMGCPLGETYPLTKGVLARRSYDDEALLFVTPNATVYTNRLAYGKMPVLQLSGLSATTVVAIETTAVYEVVPGLLTPVALQKAVFEPELSEIINLINSLPQVTTANSFTSFLKRVGLGLTTAGKWAWRNRENISRAISKGKEIVGMFG